LASKINKKFALNIEGILSLQDGFFVLEVEDVDEPVSLAELAKDFDSKKVKIAINYAEEL